jgi:1-phosphatidylinositol-4-phosphate 5-kinase
LCNLDSGISIYVVHFSRPGGIPAKNSKGERIMLYLGIIDILQSYRLKKKIEHTMKAIVIDAVSDQIARNLFSLTQ